MYQSPASTCQSLTIPPTLLIGEIYCNSGGPMSRTRREAIRSSLLGDQTKQICFPRRSRIGLVFPRDAEPVPCITGLLQQAGYSSPEELRARFSLPQNVLICRPAPSPSHGFVKVCGSNLWSVLEQAVLLGLCGRNFCDPNRSIIWTNNSLSRKLDLFEVGEFYADD